MAASVLATIVVAVVLLAFVGVSWFIVVPLAVLVIGALVAPPIVAIMRDRAVGAGAGPSGVPTSSDASYEPIKRP